MTRKIKIFFLLSCFSLLGLNSLLAADAVITPVGYSPWEVESEGLQTGKATPLTDIGVGQIVILKSENEGTYSWSLAAPDGSAAVLSSTTEREIHLIPDMTGSFVVTLDFTDSDGNASSDEITITGANYVGVGGIGGAPLSSGQCKMCHSSKVAEWEQTSHASKLQRGLDGLSMEDGDYPEECLECHTVGYDLDSLAVNGGFDDVAKEVGWTFPDTLMPGNYDSLVVNYPALAQLANIQCENCHGPGSEHNGDTSKIAVSYDAGVCSYCHWDEESGQAPPQWKNSKHGMEFEAGEHFNRSGSTCVPCHTAEGFFEVNVKEEHTSTAPYASIHGVTCAVCHDPHETAEGGEHQLRVVQDYNSVEAGGTVYATDGTPTHACDVCHHLRPGTDAPGTRPHESHQSDMLDNTVGYRYPDGTYPATNPHAELNEERCVSCHMSSPADEETEGNFVGGHTFAMHAPAAPDSGGPATDIYLTETCAQCHPGIGENFDYNGIQTKIELMLNELKSRMVLFGEDSPSYLVGNPRYSQDDVDDGTITETQMYAAYNWYVVNNDGSRGVHNPGLAVALLRDALASMPESAAALSCDINGDGQLGIADAISLMLKAKDDNTAAGIDRNGDYKYDLLDVAKLVDDIWAGTCPDGSTILASAKTDPLAGVDKITLSEDQVRYIESQLKQMNLTPEQEGAFLIALYGQGGKSGSLPKAFALAQNAPNPFNPSTTISYSVPEGNMVAVSLKIFDIRGRLVRTLVNEVKDAGTHTVFWDGTSESGNQVASGVYFYRIRAGEFTQTRKMVMLK